MSFIKVTGSTGLKKLCSNGLSCSGITNGACVGHHTYTNYCYVYGCDKKSCNISTQNHFECSENRWFDLNGMEFEWDAPAASTPALATRTVTAKDAPKPTPAPAAPTATGTIASAAPTPTGEGTTPASAKAVSATRTVTAKDASKPTTNPVVAFNTSVLVHGRRYPTWDESPVADVVQSDSSSIKHIDTIDQSMEQVYALNESIINMTQKRTMHKNELADAQEESFTGLIYRLRKDIDQERQQRTLEDSYTQPFTAMQPSPNTKPNHKDKKTLSQVTVHDHSNGFKYVILCSDCTREKKDENCTNSHRVLCTKQHMCSYQDCTYLHVEKLVGGGGDMYVDRKNYQHNYYIKRDLLPKILHNYLETISEFLPASVSATTNHSIEDQPYNPLIDQYFTEADVADSAFDIFDKHQNTENWADELEQVDAETEAAHDDADENSHDGEFKEYVQSSISSLKEQLINIRLRSESTEVAASSTRELFANLRSTLESEMRSEIERVHDESEAACEEAAKARAEIEAAHAETEKARVQSETFRMRGQQCLDSLRSTQATLRQVEAARAESEAALRQQLEQARAESEAARAAREASEAALRKARAETEAALQDALAARAETEAAREALDARAEAARAESEALRVAHEEAESISSIASSSDQAELAETENSLLRMQLQEAQDTLQATHEAHEAALQAARAETEVARVQSEGFRNKGKQCFEALRAAREEVAQLQTTRELTALQHKLALQEANSARTIAEANLATANAQVDAARADARASRSDTQAALARSQAEMAVSSLVRASSQ